METIEVILTDLDDSEAYIDLYKLNTSIPTGRSVICDLIVRSSEIAPAPVPIFVEGLGSGNFTAIRPLRDSYLSYTLNNATGANDSWLSGGYSGYLSSGNIKPSGSGDAATFGYAYEGLNKITFSSASSGTDTTGYRGQLVIARSSFSTLAPRVTKYSTPESAWLSYNTSGVNNKKVFAYNLDIVNWVSGYQSGLFGGNQYQPSELVYLSGRKYNTSCQSVSLMLDNTGITCESPAADILGEPIETCIASGLTQAEMDAKIREILNTLASGLSVLGLKTANLVDDSEVSTSTYDSSYYQYEGQIAYNDPYSGDYIKFEVYNYDYSGQYFSRFGSYPPYPAYTYYFYYSGLPSILPAANGYAVYRNINSLLTGMTGLLSTGHKVWLKDLCSDQGDLSGYFETGSLLTASVSGNYLNFISNIIGSAGKYKFTFSNVSRPNGKINKNSLKYLLPGSVTLQGANTYGTWINIDSKTGINWGRALSYTPNYYISSGWTGNSTGTPALLTPPKIGASGELIKQLIYSGHITGEDLCGKEFDNTVLFYEVPSGFSCSPEDDQNSPNIESSVRTITGLSGDFNHFDINVLRTGFSFSNNTEYNYYRLLLEDFSTNDGDQLINIANGFLINRISLFGYSPSTNYLSGTACLYGASYTGQVKGITSGIISGVLTGYADSEGKLCFNKYRVTGIPNGDGRVFFQHTSGVATTPFTGLATLCVTGTGFYTSGIEGLYFNSATNCVEFSKNVSGYITGSGQLSGGPYNVIYQSVSDLLSEKQLVVQSGVSMLTGIIPNFAYTQSNQDGFAVYTGILTGNVGPGSGGLFLNQIFNFVPANAYANILSGYYPASAILSSGAPSHGDTIYINNIPIIYTTGDDSAPLYFSNSGELIDIINSGNFSCSAAYQNGFVKLTSSENGEDGNTIPIATSGDFSFSSAAFTGGYNIYYPLSPTTIFTGSGNISILATGNFSGLATGTITGLVRQLDFYRSFTGIWDITTGFIDFNTGGLTNGNSSYINSGNQTLPYYSGQPDLIPLKISYINYPVVFSNDLAVLTITGYDINSGISVILSGTSQFN